MAMKCIRWHRCLSAWFGAVVLAVSILCVSISLAGAPARHYQVAVFTNGLTASPVLEGLQEGLAQLGYVEGQNLTLVVEDTHGAVPDFAHRDWSSPLGPSTPRRLARRRTVSPSSSPTLEIPYALA